ncbi:hypothetical protein KSC_031140 [Ktedonobacter sp. SOSP1-52]|nr:hypothetical protein KSC_031140 [Ktedonobacter sp. SOSP1-52]
MSEHLDQGIRDGLPPFTQARQGFEKGMELGRDASLGDQEDLKLACGVAQVHMKL